MKRLLLVCALLAAGITSVGAESQADEIQEAYEAFAEDLAPVLSDAALVGTNWADAYLGKFPHFGVGLYLGSAVLPLESAEAMLHAVDGSAEIPSEVSSLGGVPLPAAGISARIGGFVLPFDMGVKFGMLPTNFNVGGGATANYLAFGTDVRYAILKGNAVVPKLSIGLGYNYTSGDITISDVLDGNYMLIDGDEVGTTTVYISDPEFQMEWKSSVVHLQVQLSKKLLFLHPYIGVGAAYGVSTVGGNLNAKLTNGSGDTLSQSDIDAAVDAYEAYSGTRVDMDTGGFTSSSSLNGFSYRAYAGTSVKLLFAVLDLGAGYSFTSQSLSAQVGLRAQF